MSSNGLLIFSKSEDWGTVKTRLRPVLTDEQCLNLHVALLKDTLLKVRKHSPVLYLTGSGVLSFDPGISVVLQSGTNLGERLANAFQHEFRKHQKVIVIGTDSPTFPEEQIKKGLDLLDHHDAVFGPSEDGGYYLIGLRTLIPEIFVNIEWGSSKVLEETLRKLGERPYALLEPYFDVDTPDDLARLKKEIMTHRHLPNLQKCFDGF